MSQNLLSQFRAPDLSVFRAIVRLCSGCVLLIGLIGLLGWLLNIPAFRSLLPGLAVMKFNTAVSLIAAGAALWLTTLPEAPLRQQVRRGLALVALVISGLTLLQYALGLDFGIDQMLFADPDTPAASFPGRITLGTSVSLFLSAINLLFLIRRFYWPSQALAVVVATINLFVLVGYLLGVESLYRTQVFSTIALHTSTALFALSVGILHVTPQRGFMTIFLDRGPGGVLARGLVPAAIIIPVVLGWLIVQGEWAGFYDAIVGFALLVISSIFAFTGLIARNAYTIRQADLARQQAEDALVRRNRAYRTLSECNQALVRAVEEEQLLHQICHHITAAGGYVVAWFGAVEEPEAPDDVRLVALSLYGDGTQAALLPNGHIDPSCVRPITIRAIEMEQAQSALTFAGDLPMCTAEAERLGYASVAALPVRDNGTVFGVLHVYSGSISGFDHEEMHLLNELAGDLGYGITTLRTRAARQAAEARVRYQARLLENVSDAVIATDLEFNIRTWNRAAEQIYGWKAEEVIGSQLGATLWPRIVGDSVENILKSLREQGQWQGEVTHQRRDGQEVRVLSSVSFYTNEQGSVSGVVAVNRDVTEYVAMREKLMEAEFERVALERERELIAMKEEFVATVSHDFRTPLAVILTSSELLRRYAEKLDLERRINHLTRIHDQARYMTELVNDVLNFSKARMGRLEYQPETLDLLKFCRELYEQIQVQATPKHRFLFSSEGELDAALMDTHILQRILMNLLSNAIKYSPDGGEVRFDITREGDDVVFRVADEGIGVPEPDLKHIFQPFHRAKNTRRFQGTGLGMAIVYENVAFLGGHIALDSEEGLGTTVIVRLPYRKPATSDSGR